MTVEQIIELYEKGVFTKHEAAGRVLANIENAAELKGCEGCPEVHEVLREAVRSAPADDDEDGWSKRRTAMPGAWVCSRSEYEKKVTKEHEQYRRGVKIMRASL